MNFLSLQNIKAKIRKRVRFPYLAFFDSYARGSALHNIFPPFPLPDRQRVSTLRTVLRNMRVEIKGDGGSSVLDP